MKLLFQFEILLASLLLILVEPMAAKQLLPIFGGSAAVWITCLVFFQASLLAGYLYAHALSRGRNAKFQFWLHCVLLGTATGGAIAWATGWQPGVSSQQPALSILLSLTTAIGLPFILLGATSPLLQVWLSRVNGGPVPYRLFALSNLASLLALFAYPSLIEPLLPLHVQRTAWAGGVALFAMISSVLAWKVRGFTIPTGAPVVRNQTPARTRLLWYLLAVATAMQLSAITAHLTANIAAIPLLWTLPLAVYLITFILAFQFTRLPRLPLLGVSAVLLISLGQFLTNPSVALPIGLAIGIFLAELFFVCLCCHGELYRLRPADASDATFFYLTIAAGGATGSFLIGIAAPLLFRANPDLSITFTVTAGVLMAVCWTDGLTQRVLGAGTVGLLLWFCVVLQQSYRANTLFSIRNFYGSLRVRQSLVGDGPDAGEPMRTLMHGTIIHGTQIFAPALMRTPTTYFAPSTGIGLAFNACHSSHPGGLSAGIVGLGAGSLAAYGRPGDRFRFYEINPAVQTIAGHFFTYLRQSQAQIRFVEGDGRASLAAESPQGFDLLVVDAFSGDAIPLHLLTTQALATYRRQLLPDGVLAFHTSNQFVELEPELAALARSSGLTGRVITTDDDPATGQLRATWVLMTGNPEFFRASTLAGFRGLKTRASIQPWTDDYSSLLPLVRCPMPNE